MKDFFLSRLLREKLLLLGLAVVGAAMWFSGLSTRLSVFWHEFHHTSSDLEEQRQWLDQRDAIEKSAKAAVGHLEPSKTLNSVRLQTELDAIARNAGLSNTSADDPRTEQTTQFSINTIQFTVRNADYESLVKFYNELSKRAPYIGIEQFSIQSNRADPRQLNAALRVSSVEIAR